MATRVFRKKLPCASGGGDPKASAQKHCLWPNSRLGEALLMQRPLVPPYLRMWPTCGPMQG